MTRFFLDTSAHIERHAGDAPHRSEVDELLKDDRHATSTHVRREWKGTIDKGAVDLLNALRGSTDMSDVYSRASQGWGRAPGQRLRVLSMLSGGSSTDLSTLRLRAQTFLRSESEALFMHRIDDLRNGSDCGLSKEQAVREAGGRWTLKTQCRKAECECRQDDFLEERRERLLEAAAALDSADTRPADRKMGRKAQEVMKSSDRLARKGKNCFGAGGLGGDLSIALECQDDEILLTTDESFEVIGPAIGIRVRRLEATPPP